MLCACKNWRATWRLVSVTAASPVQLCGASENRRVLELRSGADIATAHHYVAPSIPASQFTAATQGLPLALESGAFQVTGEMARQSWVADVSAGTVTIAVIEYFAPADDDKPI